MKLSLQIIMRIREELGRRLGGVHENNNKINLYILI